MRIVLQEIVVDCRDPRRLAEFWGALLGVTHARVHDGWWIVDAEPLRLAFQQVPEGKESAKNRLHLDVEVPVAEEAVTHALALGAAATGQAELDERGDGYVVLRDPELNEFCLVVDRSGTWARTQAEALAAARSA